MQYFGAFFRAFWIPVARFFELPWVGVSLSTALGGIFLFVVALSIIKHFR